MQALIVIGIVPGLGDPAEAAPRDNHPFPAAIGLSTRCNGCSCKCGPGYRLPSKGVRAKGDCASWTQHWEYARKGYPSGSVDEIDLPTTDINPLCPPEAIKEKRMIRD
jgi:hypothetical protein